MSAPSHFEIVHTGARKFHARFRAGNGETVWVTESYTTRRAAMSAIEILMNAIDPRGATLGHELEVREVDERA